jgi:hypothetical protein
MPVEGSERKGTGAGQGELAVYSGCWQVRRSLRLIPDLGEKTNFIDLPFSL